MAQRFTFFGARLVQLDRQALFCDPTLLLTETETQPETKHREDKRNMKFLSLQRVLRVSDLPPGDTYGLEYEIASTPTRRRRVLVRVMPFLDCQSNNNKKVHGTHHALVQENRQRYYNNNKNNNNILY
uniref:Uncharacterized protein n=1 Tax=Amphora coffeiformis TaxID=265554 RepID=A0A6S8J771_9STRA